MQKLGKHTSKGCPDIIDILYQVDIQVMYTLYNFNILTMYQLFLQLLFGSHMKLACV